MPTIKIYLTLNRRIILMESNLFCVQIDLEKKGNFVGLEEDCTWCHSIIRYNVLCWLIRSKFHNYHEMFLDVRTTCNQQAMR